MADPICRWRFVSRETIRELVSLLPKQEMPEALFKQHLQKACVTAEISYEDFTSTAYQLAVQLGLYYIDDNAIPSNKVAYNYYVVLSDNNESKLLK